MTLDFGINGRFSRRALRPVPGELSLGRGELGEPTSTRDRRGWPPRHGVRSLATHAGSRAEGGPRPGDFPLTDVGPVQAFAPRSTRPAIPTREHGARSREAAIQGDGSTSPQRVPRPRPTLRQRRHARRYRPEWPSRARPDNFDSPGGPRQTFPPSTAGAGPGRPLREIIVRPRDVCRFHGGELPTRRSPSPQSGPGADGVTKKNRSRSRIGEQMRILTSSPTPRSRAVQTTGATGARHKALSLEGAESLIHMIDLLIERSPRRRPYGRS